VNTGWILAASCLLLLASAAGQTVAETHSRLQAVNADGTSAWTGATPFAVTGVILNNPGDMLDPAPGFAPWNDGEGLLQMGGQWQLVCQSVDPSDRGGTLLWMGQNYGNLPFLRDTVFSHGDEVWAGELARVNHDAATGHRFQAGDLVRITARRCLFRGGQRNINEAHDTDPAADFEMSLVTANYGLPPPEIISLSDLVRKDDGNPETREDIFDSSRATGGERYQGTRVRLTHLRLVTTNGWNPPASWSDRFCTVTDGENRYFQVVTPRYSLGPAPTGVFDAVGVVLQESGSGVDGTYGYELFVQEVVPHAPLLVLARGGHLTWPETEETYQLEYAPSLAEESWKPCTNAPALVGGRYEFVAPLSERQCYFRLRRSN
jgi:hypothetical protein